MTMTTTTKGQWSHCTAETFLGVHYVKDGKYKGYRFIYALLGDTNVARIKRGLLTILDSKSCVQFMSAVSSLKRYHRSTTAETPAVGNLSGIRSLASKAVKISPKNIGNISNAANVDLSRQAVQRILHTLGFLERVARPKPLLRKVNRRCRKKRTQEVKKPLLYWRCIIFSDESRYHQFTSDARFMLTISEDPLKSKCL